MMLGALVFVVAVLGQPLPEPGPIYDLLQQFREANPATPEEQAQWAEDILAALKTNPNEEWSTRISAYEDAGSVYWRTGDYGRAAEIFLGQMQEAEQRGDNGESVRSLDNLINLYDEAKFPVQDVMDFYDATEAWLEDPPPGQEQTYSDMLHQLYNERAGKLEGFAREAENDQARREYLQQAEYFRQLANDTADTPHATNITLAQVAAHWFKKNREKGTAPPPREGEAPAAPAVQSPTRPPTPIDTAKKEPPPAPAKPEPLPAPTPETKSETPPRAESGLSSEVVIGICVAIIALGWGGAAYYYLKRGK